MAVSGGDILVELFQSYGIEYIFCSPGSEWVPVWDGIARRHSQGEKTPKYINCRHESLAVSMAMGYAKATGRLPAVLLHANVGPLQGAMAIRTAHIARVPMIICCAEASDHGEDGAKAFGQHWLRHLADIGGTDSLVRPYVKWSNKVNSRNALLDSVFRGYYIAQTAPQGPILLAISMELLFKSLPEAKISPPSPIAGLPEPRPVDMEEVAEQLIESRQPLIITEHAGESIEAVDRLAELAELLSIPVFEYTEPMFGNFPRNHPMHMGYDASEALQEADTVFVVGGAIPWYPPSSFPRNDAKVILLDRSPLHERLPYWGFQPDLLLTADIVRGLSVLLDTVRSHIRKSGRSAPLDKQRFERWQAMHDQSIKKWEKEALAGQNNRPISPGWFFHLLKKTSPEDTIFLDETILHGRFVKPYLIEPGKFIRVCYGGLGFGLGETAGTKLARPDKPVVFLVGDGTFNYNPVLAGLGVCQEYHLPVLIIILNNNGYIAMRRHYHEHLPDGWAAIHKEYLGVDINPPPDYCKVAEAFEAFVQRLEVPDDIEPTLNKAFEQIARGRTAFIDVTIDT